MRIVDTVSTMFDSAKRYLISLLPASRRNRSTEPTWLNLLVYVVGYTLLMGLYHGAWLFLFVWVIRRYWWHGMPPLGFLPAWAIATLFDIRRSRRPAPASQP